MRGDGGVAAEGRIVGIPLANINSDWMSNLSSGLCIILGYIHDKDPLIHILGCKKELPFQPAICYLSFR